MLSNFALLIDNWEKTATGDKSTSGTTVSCDLIQHGCVYVANVGDSKVIWGNYNPKYGKIGEPEVIAKEITENHKPENKNERMHIESLGGKVTIDGSGVTWVVWE